jgi:hypothetical protein
MKCAGISWARWAALLPPETARRWSASNDTFSSDCASSEPDAGHGVKVGAATAGRTLVRETAARRRDPSPGSVSFLR